MCEWYVFLAGTSEVFSLFRCPSCWWSRDSDPIPNIDWYVPAFFEDYLRASKFRKKKHPIQGEWSCCNHLCWTKSGLGVEFFTDPIVVDTISMWLCLKICYHQFQWVIILFPMKLYEKNDQIAHFQPIKPWLFSSANRQSRISWLTPGTRWFRAWSKASPKFPAMISSRWAPRVSGPGS